MMNKYLARYMIHEAEEGLSYKRINMGVGSENGNFTRPEQTLDLQYHFTAKKERGNMFLQFKIVL